MMCLVRFSAGILVVGALSACGGGSGPVQVEDPTPPREVQSASGNETPAELADPIEPFEVFGTEEPEEEETAGSVLEATLEASEDDVVVLSGIGIVRDEATGQRILVRRDGEFNRSESSRTLNNLAIDLTDDVPGAFVVTSGFKQEVIGNPTMVGVVGVPTKAGDMPTAGSASFSGGAVILAVTPDAGFDMRNGQSVVSVDFATGKASATLSDFTNVSQVSGNLTDAPLDSLVLTDADIVGTGFTGGTVTTTGDLTLAQIVGGNASVQAEGQFFGLTGSGDAPAEVGALIHAEGDSGLIFGSLIAD